MAALFWRDLILAFRSGGGFGLALAFFLIVVMLVPFGIGNDLALLARVAPGVLWVGALLSCLLSLDRIFQIDFEDGSLEALATAPIPLEGIVAAKACAHWVSTGLPLTLAAIPLGVLLNLPTEAYGATVLSLLLGTPALSFIGAFAASLTLGVKRGGLILSLIVLPLYMPVLIFGAQIVTTSQSGQNTTPLVLALAGLTLGCFAILPFVSAMSIRAGLR